MRCPHCAGPVTSFPAKMIRDDERKVMYVERLIEKRIRELDRGVHQCERYIEEQRLILSNADEELKELLIERDELRRVLK